FHRDLAPCSPGELPDRDCSVRESAADERRSVARLRGGGTDTGILLRGGHIRVTEPDRRAASQLARDLRPLLIRAGRRGAPVAALRPLLSVGAVSRLILHTRTRTV